MLSIWYRSCHLACPYYPGRCRMPLLLLRHHHPKNIIDTRGIASAILLKPLEHVGIQTHGHQLLWGPPKLSELLIGELRNIGIVDLRGIREFLPPCDGVQRRFLAFSQGPVPDRFGAHADL